MRRIDKHWREGVDAANSSDLHCKSSAEAINAAVFTSPYYESLSHERHRRAFLAGFFQAAAHCSPSLKGEAEAFILRHTGPCDSSACVKCPAPSCSSCVNNAAPASALSFECYAGAAADAVALESVSGLAPDIEDNDREKWRLFGEGCAHVCGAYERRPAAEEPEECDSFAMCGGPCGGLNLRADPACGFPDCLSLEQAHRAIRDLSRELLSLRQKEPPRYLMISGAPDEKAALDFAEVITQSRGGIVMEDRGMNFQIFEIPKAIQLSEKQIAGLISMPCPVCGGPIQPENCGFPIMPGAAWICIDEDCGHECGSREIIAAALTKIGLSLQEPIAGAHVGSQGSSGHNAEEGPGAARMAPGEAEEPISEESPPIREELAIGECKRPDFWLIFSALIYAAFIAFLLLFPLRGLK